MPNKRLQRIGFIFSLPSILFFIFFISIPVIFTIFLTFASWQGYDLAQIKLVGIKNFVDVFTDRIMLKSFINTLIFVLFTTTFLNFFGFFGALIHQ